MIQDLTLEIVYHRQETVIALEYVVLSVNDSRWKWLMSVNLGILLHTTIETQIGKLSPKIKPNNNPYG